MLTFDAFDPINCIFEPITSRVFDPAIVTFVAFEFTKNKEFESIRRPLLFDPVSVISRALDAWIKTELEPRVSVVLHPV